MILNFIREYVREKKLELKLSFWTGRQSGYLFRVFTCIWENLIYKLSSSNWPTLKTHHNNKKVEFAKVVKTLTYKEHWEGPSSQLSEDNRPRSLSASNHSHGCSNSPPNSSLENVACNSLHRNCTSS